MSLSWFPLYHGDYLRDTRSLSVAEHGCYLLLIMEFFSQGPLPDNIDRLCLIAAGASPETVRFILTTYWDLVDGKWTNRKAEKVKATQIEKGGKRAAAGRLGGLSKASNARNLLSALPQQCSTNQNQNQIDSRSTRGASHFAPPTPPEVREYAKSIGYLIRAELFCDHYAARGWRLNGGQPMKDWRAAVRTWKARDQAAKPAAPKEAIL